MDSDPQTQVSLLLQEIRDGNRGSQEHLIRLVYQELRRLADSLMNQERPDHTLEPTALVHEAWMRLLNQSALHNLTDRRHFFGAAVRAMRQVLVDHARNRAALRRGGERKRVPLDDMVEALEKKSIDIQSLDAALNELSGLNQRQAQVVTLRFFGGLSMEEIARNLDVSLSTIESDFRVARAWLRCRVSSDI